MSSTLLATSLFGQPVLLRLGPVDRDLEGRIVELLLDACIDDAGNLPHLLQHIVGHATVGIDVLAADLDVDRRRQTEIEDLGDHVCRQRIKRDGGKVARQRQPDLLHIAIGRMMVFLELDHDVGVGGTDHARRRMGKVHAAVRQADIVDDRAHFVGWNDFTDFVFDEVAIRAVSSMRVPVLARIWKVNCPLSVFGKKSWPSQGASAKTARTQPRNTGRKIFGYGRTR